MRRRACDACVKSRQTCSRCSPRCSRCIKLHKECSYDNELPIAAPPAQTRTLAPAPAPAREDGHHIGTSSLTTRRFDSLDPFDSYPPTRLPRNHVKRLIHSFLNKIAFQYYPLDLNAASNPFLISWWPLALGDAALFHVSLLTACLDHELSAQKKGLRVSDLLMADSVALLRRKVEDPSLAIQDGTINSVIILAAIEFDKGNLEVSKMHVDGVKILVNIRGGINSVRQSSPLTARMVSWVSMLIAGHPQFEAQDDVDIRDGIPPIPEWQLGSIVLHNDLSRLSVTDAEYSVKNVSIRLRYIFQRAQRIPFPTTRLHDLTCFVVHRLLLLPPATPNLQSSPINECIRYAIILYMFIIQGPTYCSHELLLKAIVTRFLEHLKQFESIPHLHSSLDLWLLAIGMVAATGTTYYQCFIDRASVMANSLLLNDWNDALGRIKSVLWLETLQGEDIFRPHWDAILSATSQPGEPDFTM